MTSCLKSSFVHNMIESLGQHESFHLYHRHIMIEAMKGCKILVLWSSEMFLMNKKSNHISIMFNLEDPGHLQLVHRHHLPPVLELPRHHCFRRALKALSLNSQHWYLELSQHSRQDKEFYHLKILQRRWYHHHRHQDKDQYHLHHQRHHHSNQNMNMNITMTTLTMKKMMVM